MPILSHTPPSLAEDSLGHALLTSAELIAEVVGGTTLTDALARLWDARPATPAGVRGAILDLTYGTLRDYGRQDFILGKLLQKPLPEPLQSLLRVALHRLAVRPDTAHTVVDQAVSAAATLLGGKFKGVANGVLRNALRQAGELAQAADADMVAEHRHPPWWIRRLKGQYPQKWRAILAAGNSHPPMALRVNPLRASDDEVLADFAAAGIAVKRLAPGTLRLEQPIPVSRIPGFAEGCVSVQDAGAQHAARHLDLADGQRVLDACAAPGGKTAHLLELADLDLLALDIDAARTRRIDENLQRLGLRAEVKVADCSQVKSWWDGRPFDAILADVPCSASGVVRRYPDIKRLRRESDIRRLVHTQAQILDVLWSLLKPGGHLLYATCSVFPEENGAQIDAFLVRQPGAQRVSEERLLPQVDRDGFYYALLRKPD